MKTDAWNYMENPMWYFVRVEKPLWYVYGFFYLDHFQLRNIATAICEFTEIYHSSNISSTLQKLYSNSIKNWSASKLYTETLQMLFVLS